MAVGRANRAEVDVGDPQLDVAPGRVEVGLAFLLASAVSAAHVAIAQAHGALGASRNDDWAYYRITYRLADKGVFELNGWAQMMLVGQAVLAWPIVKLFGPEIAPLQIMVAVLGACGLWAAYLLVRSFLPRGWSAFAVGCLALGPVFGSLSVSFMTDVPAFSLQMLSLLAGQRALRSRNPSTAWFVGSLGLALAAFSIREYGAAAGFAVSVVVLSRAWSLDSRLAKRLAATAAAALICALVLFVWRSGLAHSTPTDLALSTSHLHDAVRLLWRVAVTLALFVSPAAFAVSPVRLVRAVRTRVPIIGSVIVVVAVVLAARWRLELQGNYVTPTGSYALTLPGPGPHVVPDLAWTLLRWLGLASLVVVALLAAVTLAGRRRPADGVGAQVELRSKLRRPDLATPEALVRVFAASTVAIAVVVIMATTALYFDRYLIGLVPVVAALVIRAGRDHELLVRWTGCTATVSLAALALVGLIFVDASATFDGGKWRLASAVEHQGFQAATIDGGFEWFGYHQTDPAEPRPATEGRSFWVTDFSDRPVCATSTLQTPPTQRLPDAETDPDVIASLTVRSLLGVDYRLTAVAGPQLCHEAPASNPPTP